MKLSRSVGDFKRLKSLQTSIMVHDIGENRKNEDPSPVTGRFKIYVRVRPENSEEREYLIREMKKARDGAGKNKSLTPIIEVMDSRCLVFDPPPSKCQVSGRLSGTNYAPKASNIRYRDVSFAFDGVFPTACTQDDVYNVACENLLDPVFEGFTSTIFCYGATGAGKTYTMMGNSENPGIMVKAFTDIFTKAQSLKEQSKSVDVSLSYLEVHNERIMDLLVPNSPPLMLLEDAKKGILIKGLSESTPTSASETMRLLRQGNLRRKQSPTDRNAESSRSHAILQINVKVSNVGRDIVETAQQGKLILVDLAGSERASGSTNQGMRKREGSNINKSLLALGNCINALCQRGRVAKTFVPYRNSKLTRLLKDALNGNSLTTMIANISESRAFSDDSFNSLKYANRAKNIRIKAKRTTLTVENHIAEYKSIVNSLKTENEQLKKMLAEERKKTVTSKTTQRSITDPAPAAVETENAISRNAQLDAKNEEEDTESSKWIEMEFTTLVNEKLQSAETLLKKERSFQHSKIKEAMRRGQKRTGSTALSLNSPEQEMKRRRVELTDAENNFNQLMGRSSELLKEVQDAPKSLRERLISEKEKNEFAFTKKLIEMYRNLLDTEILLFRASDCSSTSSSIDSNAKKVRFEESAISERKSMFHTHSPGGVKSENARGASNVMYRRHSGILKKSRVHISGQPQKPVFRF